SALEERCRDLGACMIAIDEDRAVVWPAHQDQTTLDPAVSGDSCSSSAHSTAVVRQHVLNALEEGRGGDLAEPFALDDTLTAVPVPVMERRRAVGTVIAVIKTPGISSSGNGDAALKQSASASASEAARISPAAMQQVLRHALSDLRNLEANTSEMETLSQQLCNTYEEINLLHKVGEGMDVVRHPQRFLHLVCQELLEVLPFRWIGVRLLPNHEMGTLLGDMFVTEGLDEDHRFDANAILTAFLTRLEATENILVNDADASDRIPSIMGKLGQAMLICPLSRDREVYGAVIAVDKQGDDRMINSVDVNLINTTVASVKVFLDNAALYQDQQRMFLGTLEALTASIDAKDAYTCGHSRRVALLSQQIGAAAGFNEDRVRRIHIAGLVHDVGKIGVPESVLCKPGRLTDDEFELIKQHPEIGARILRDIPHFEDILPGVLHHHERYDGRGYPGKLEGDSIPELGRIIAVADSFDAMSSTRTYRSALHRARVMDEMRNCSGTQFDPQFVDAFMQVDLTQYDEIYDWDRSGIGKSGSKAA
ncbi:MAG: HD-GYP domain-containing protein, partial [Planctomycetota bacterium]